MEKYLKEENILLENDVYGKALYDYYLGKDASGLYINTSYKDVEEMPVEVFYRDFDDFPILEAIALESCQGNVLDVGAGTGCHSLILQDKGHKVTPIDASVYCTKIMQLRGIDHVCQADFFTFDSITKHDTILLMMNGLGIVGELERLPLFLKKCESMLSPNGKILFDSSNVQYLQDEFGIGSQNKYIGEIAYQYVYKGIAGDWFDWLYVDKENMKSITTQEGWTFDLLYENEQQQYLASIQKLDR